MRLPGECKPSAIPGSATQPEGIGALGGNSGGGSDQAAWNSGGARAGEAFAQETAEAAHDQWRVVADQSEPRVPKLAAS